MNNENTHLQAAIAAMQRNDMITATVEATKAIQSDPQCYEAYIIRGQISMAYGDKRGAAEDMKRALELRPDLQEQLSGQFKN
jgi:Tfp pilus assembly protein PilF